MGRCERRCRCLRASGGQRGARDRGAREAERTRVSATSARNSSYASIATQGRKTVVLTDSHGSRIKGKELPKWIDNGIGLIRSFPGSTATYMLSYAIPTIQNDKPDQVILHVGCNEILKGERDARKIADNIFEVARFCRRGGVNIVYISGILVMNSFNHNNIARKVNYILSTEGPLENFYFIMPNLEILIRQRSCAKT